MSGMLEKIATRTWPLMTVAVILIGGLMYWLYAASSSIETAVVGPDMTSLPRIAAADFGADPEAYSRDRILVTPVKVVMRLGRAALALDLPGRPGYPVILDRPVLEAEFEVIAGDNLTVAGWVYALNDSILDVWSQRSLFDQDNRQNLEGYTTFLLVDSIDFVIVEETSPPDSI